MHRKSLNRGAFALLLTLAALVAPAHAQVVTVEKSLVAPGAMVQTGEPVQYRLQVACSGLDTPCGPTSITDELPAELEFVSCQGVPSSGGQPAFTCDATDPQNIVWSTTNFLAGSTVNLIINVQVALDAPVGTLIDNTGDINAPDDVDDFSTVDTGSTIEVVAGTPQYVVRKTRVSPDPAAGFPVIYDVSFCASSGIGNLPLNGISLVDTIVPAGATILDSGGGEVVLNPAGDTITWTTTPAVNTIPPGTPDPIDDFVGNGNEFDIVTAYTGEDVSGERCMTRRVILRFDSPPFSGGDMYTNSAAIFGDADPDNVPPVPGPLGSVDLDETLGPPDPMVNVSKTAPDVTFGGDSMQWTLNADNAGSNVPTVDLRIYEAIPPITDGPANPPSGLPGGTVPVSVTSGQWSSPMYFDTAGVLQTSMVLARIDVATGGSPSAPADCVAASYSDLTGTGGEIASPGSPITYTLPPTATCVRWTFRDASPTSNPVDAVPQGWSFTTSPVFTLDTSAVPDPDLVASGDFVDVRNCLYAEFDGDSDAGTVGDTEAAPLGCGTAQIEEPTAAVVLGKSREVFTPEGVPRSGGAPFPGDEIVYTLSLSHEGANSTDDIVNPIIADLLPADVEYDVLTVWEDYDDNEGSGPIFPYLEIVDDFVPGRTLLRFSWSELADVPPGAVDFNGLTPTVGNPASFSESDDPITITIRVRVIDGTPESTPIGNQAFAFNRGPLTQCGSNDGLAPNVEDTVPPNDTSGMSTFDYSGNDNDGAGTATDDPGCASPVDATIVAAAAVLGGAKFVQGNGMGDRDNVDNPLAAPEIGDDMCPGGLTGFTRTPCVAQTDHVLEPNSDNTFTYRLDIVNTGNAPLTNYVLYDVLPDVGDTGVGPALIDTPRESTFRPQIAGVVTYDASGGNIPEPADVVIEYTTAETPCRNELEGDPPFTDDWPPGCSNSYGPFPTGSESDVTGFRITIPFGTGTGVNFMPGQRMSFIVPMLAPEGSLISTPSLFEDGNAGNDLFNPAWNTFAHRAQEVDGMTNPYLLAAEPPRVGVILPEAYRIGNLVWLDSNHNGISDAGEPGIAGVTVSVLSDESGDGPTADDLLYGTTVTDGNGKYDFTGLPPGLYYVVIHDGQNGAGGPLEELFTSTFGQDVADSDVDNADDGIIVATGLGGFDQDGIAQAATFDGLASGTSRLGPVTLGDAADTEPTDERLRAGSGTDDDNDSFPDAFSNLSIDFGYYRPFALGNRVFLDEGGADADVNNGVQDAGEVGIPDIEVRLLDGAGNPFDADPDSSGIQQPTTLTDPNGYYLFDGLPAGDFRVEVAFGAAQPKLASSTGALPGSGFEPAPDPDATDTDQDDSGTTVTPGLVFRSGTVTLGAPDLPAEPTDDLDRPANANPQGQDPDGNQLPDDQSNLAVDFGFFTPVSIGSTVFEDPNNNGVQDAPGESGLPAADLGLYAPGPDGVIGGGDDFLVASTTTDSSGDYLFRDLPPGSYYVQVEASSFAGGRGLENFPTSSLPTATADDNVDGNDDGFQAGGGTVVRSPLIALTINGEVLGDGSSGDEDFQGGGQDDDTTSVGDDDNGNMTVDFGFIPADQLVSIGSTVFQDPNNNGLQDGGEAGIGGVTVELLQDTNGNGVIDGPETTAFLTTTTSTSGQVGNYFFGDLPPANYQVRIPVPPVGFVLSSTPTDTADNREDGDDNGSQPGGAGTLVLSPVISLVPGEEPDEGDGFQGQDQDNGNELNGDMTVDFGFVDLADPADVVSVGSTVFLDAENNGILDATDAGIDGVTVALLRTGPDTMAGTADDIPIASSPTAGGGDYFFGQLPPEADYYLEIAFPPIAAPLSSTPTTFTDDGDANVDNDDNGIQPGGPGTVVRSPVFELSPGDEPTGNGSTGDEFGQGGDQDAADDDNGDMTFDFGFFAELEADVVSVGSTVFFDVNNNGIQDDMIVDAGIDGVLVQLWDTGADGASGTPDDFLVTSALTAGGGDYFFPFLPQGDYFIRIPTPPAAAPLSSTPTVVADDNADGDDNGAQPGGIGTLVESGVFNLTSGEEVEDDEETFQGGDQDVVDENGNMTLDFGFVPVFDIVAVGSTVFEDGNNNGVQDDPILEPGIGDVDVELYDPGPDEAVGGGDDILIDATVTDGSGNYLFDELPPRNYYLVVAQSSFDPGRGLATRLLSSTFSADSDDNVDGNDDGTQALGFGTPSISPVFDLAPGEEVGDDVETFQGFDQDNDGIGADEDNGNMTLDFGFVPVTDVVAIGSTLFLDPNNNGFQDDPILEPGIDGVEVALWLPGDDGAIGGGDDRLLTTVDTNGSGDYLFDNLPAGEYFVRIPVPPAIAPLSSTPTSTADDGNDEDDNGIQPGGIGTEVLSPVILLELDNEPLDGDEPGQGGDQDAGITGADENNGDMTVDFGFVPVLDIVAVGSTVFEDGNNSGTQDVGEPGVGDVDVELYDPGPDEVIGGGDDFLIASTTTNVAGNYLFDELPPRNYYLVVAQSSFDPGRGLATRLLSSTFSAESDDNVDGNDDGTQALGFGTPSISPLFDLSIDGEVGDDFETFQGFDQDNDATGADEDNGNMTLDFGFVPVTDVVALGSTVFIDPDNDGFQDGTEAGIDGIGVELWLVGDDGAIGGGDDRLLTTVVTNGAGDYLFDNLPAGAYYVRIPVPPAIAPLSSTRTSTLDDGADEDDNGSQPGGIGTETLSPVITLQINVEPDDGTEPGQGGGQDAGLIGADDDNGDMTVDFGFVPVFDVTAIGSTVFADPDDSGTQGAGEPGLAGTGVQLWVTGPDTVIGGSDDLLLTTTLTDGTGDYLFDNLPEGRYYLRIPNPPLGAPRSSTFDGTADNQVDGDDNGAQQVFNGPVLSPIIQLNTNSEPDDTLEPEQGGLQDDGIGGADDDNGDMTVDFGFIPEGDLVAIGSTVFLDIDNDGIQGGGESGIAGIELALFRVGPDGLPGTPDDEDFGTTTSDGNGDYLFTNLPPGKYFIEIAAPPAAAPLSSTPTDTEDNQVDGNDNGDQPGGAGTVVTSPVVMLLSGTEPEGETEQGGAQDDADDTAGDMTVDFGFVDPLTLVAVGSTVFEDPNNNGTQDVTELGLADTEVQLWRPGSDGMIGGTDDDFVASVQTDGNGDYYFGELPPGRYYVRLPTPPDGFALSSTPTGLDDDQVDGDDNGLQPGGFGGEAFSPVFSLDVDSEPVAGAESFQGGAQDDADDDNGDMSLDFGFVPAEGVVSIGSTVFSDPNNNGLQEAGEPGVAGIEVELYAPGPDGVIGGGDDVRLSTTVTDGGGNYFFGQLPPGDFFVEVPTPPAGLPLSSTPTSSADDQVDEDDNGSQPGGAGAVTRSPLVSLGIGAEPTGEPGQGGAQDADDDASGDMTIDFGFVPTDGAVSIGSTVFVDDDNDGRQGAGEAGIPGVEVLLYAPGPDGEIGGGDDILTATTTTDPNGDYFFGNLPSGVYYVQIPTPPASAPLSSTPTSQADDQVDGDDNGAQPGGFGTVTTSPLVTLSVGGEPTVEPGQGGDQDAGDDASGDMTVDFGFVPVDGAVSLGSTVFVDDDNDGFQDADEPGIPGVALILHDPGPDGAPGGGDDIQIAATTTDPDGDYFFGNLPPGNYYVQIPTPPASAPLSSTPTSGADDQNDGDDNGAQPGGIGAVTTSPVVNLAIGSEPTAEPGQGGDQDAGDDGSGDMTVDFGFVPTLGVVSIGSTVFVDGDNDGVQDGGEPGIPGVTLILYDPGPDGEPGGGDDIEVATTVTDPDGNYLFANLPPETYYLLIPSPPIDLPLSSTPTSPDDDQSDGDDNGLQPGGAGAPTTSPVIELGIGQEPVGEPGPGGDQDDGDDGNGDMTVDFGFTSTEPVFDLALSKSLAEGQPTIVAVGDVVRFVITVMNQGTAPASNIKVVDYVPAGLMLDDAAWALDGSVASRTIDGPLVPGAMVDLEIRFLVVSETVSSAVNVAEIAAFTDPDGVPRDDEDSTPDDDPDNDAGGSVGTPSDDATDGDGSGAAGDGDPDTDEDDSDPAGVAIGSRFDLSLVKQLAAGQPPSVLDGGQVRFEIVVTNEGTIPATDILVVDYLPEALRLVPDDTWSVAAGGRAEAVIAVLEPGSSITLVLVAEVVPGARGTLSNGAEIASASDPVGNPGVDADSTPDNDPDNDPGDEDDRGATAVTVSDPRPIPVLSPWALLVLALLLGGLGGRRSIRARRAD